MFPDMLALGMEIRVKVSDYVHDRILALRSCVSFSIFSRSLYSNDSMSSTKTSLTCWVQAKPGPVPKRQCDPHQRDEVPAQFLRQGPDPENVPSVPGPAHEALQVQVAHCQQDAVGRVCLHSRPRRALASRLCVVWGVSVNLAAQAIVYTITDVISMNEWIVESFADHPLFERLTEAELTADPLIEHLYVTTEEGQKVARNKALGQVCSLALSGVFY
jgi:tRNA (guanine-N7-)-methyltransferase